MARDFDGTNDNVDFASDASIDGFTSQTIAFWAQNDAGNNVFDVWANKWTDDVTNTGWRVTRNSFNTPDSIQFLRNFIGSIAEWYGGDWGTGLTHIVITYDNTSTANDPIIYQDGSIVSLTEVTAPVGTANSDASSTLRIGEAGDGSADADGRIMAFCYDNAIWSAAQVNRARWWGTPGGGVEVYHPMWISDLTNKGTATANGTATGTTVASLPRVERCWGTMMGVGR